jgi:hypothetical protein
MEQGRQNYRFTPAASAKSAACAGGVVPAAGGGAKDEFLALIAFE